MLFSETKLHDYLSKLNVYEWNQFLKYLASPLHNKNNEILDFCQWLSGFYKNEKAHKLTKTEVWKALYKTKAYNDLRFRRVCSDTLALVEDFFAYLQYRKEPNQKWAFVLAAMNERDLGKYFPANYAYIERIQEKDQAIDSYDYWLSYFTALQKASYLEKESSRLSDKNIRETVSKLDDYYLIMKLRFYAAQLHYQQISVVREDDLLMQDILNYLQKHSISHNPIANIYYHIIGTFEHKTEPAYYHKLKALLLKHSSGIAHEVSRDMYAFALNYCIRQINTGNIDYQQEIFELYEKMLDERLLFDKDELSPFDFKNIITIALRIKQFKWTEKFIATYHSTLPKEHQANALSFNTARLHFAKQEYQKVLPLLQDVEYSDVFYMLDSKTTLFKTYFELNEYDALLSLAESFRVLLSRKKIISEQHRNNYTNFIRIALKIFRSEHKNKKQLAQIAELFQEAKGIADKGWLLEKYKAIGGEAL